jgi:hypothetical protein
MADKKFLELEGSTGAIRHVHHDNVGPIDHDQYATKAGTKERFLNWVAEVQNYTNTNNPIGEDGGIALTWTELEDGSFLVGGQRLW